MRSTNRSLEMLDTQQFGGTPDNLNHSIVMAGSPQNMILANSGGMSGGFHQPEVGGIVIRAGNDRDDHNTTASDDRGHMKATFTRGINDNASQI